MIARSNELAAAEPDLPELHVWPRWRDHDHVHLTGRCPRCRRPRPFSLTGSPWRSVFCPCGGGDVRLIIHAEPVPADLAYEIEHEPEDLAMMAEILRPVSRGRMVADLLNARRPTGKRRRVSRDAFRTATEAIGRSGIFAERHAIMVENGAHALLAMRALVAGFIRKQRGRTMRHRFYRAVSNALKLAVRGEEA